MSLIDEDREALTAIELGERERFRELVERHAPVVYSILRRVGANPDLAEDLSQETFVRAWAGLRTFRGECRFRTWVVQIALNLARDRVRSATRGPRLLSLEEAAERGSLDRERRAADAPVEDSLQDAPEGLATRLERAIAALPPPYREAFVLRHVEELSYEEMSHATGQSIGSLKVRVHRARVLLRESLSSDRGRGDRHGRLAGSLS